MKRVAVLRGGPSQEYDVSMKSGEAVISALRALKYPFKDIVITRKGEWLEEGFVKVPDSALEAVDVVFLALHGEYGEDGQIQRILQRKNIPFTGSRALPSAIAFNKELTKNTLLNEDIKMPRHRRMLRNELDRLDEEIPQIFKEIGDELFVKSVTGGSSLGVKHVQDPAGLKQALEELLAEHEQVLIEEFIRGREATVGVIGDFRNEKLYALPVIEIVPPNGNPVFTYEDKYNGTTEEIVPGRFSYHEKSKLAEAATIIHNALDCDHYSRSDFIVKDGEVYFLELNTLPGLTAESLFPKAAAAVGLEFPQLISHLVETATV